MGLLIVHPIHPASDAVHALYNLNYPVTRNYINSLFGGAGDTFAELTKDLKTIPKEYLKEYLTNAAEEFTKYADAVAESDDAFIELESIQAFINELFVFAEIYKDECSAALNQV